MHTIVTDERVARFIASKLGTFCPPYTCMGIERDGEIVSGVLFNGFEAANIHVTAAGKWWPKNFLRMVGQYVFDQLGCERMTYTMRSHEVAHYIERLGGKREGVLRSYYGPGQDAIIVGVLRGEWMVR